LPSCTGRAHACFAALQRLGCRPSSHAAVIKLPHADSFDREKPLTHKNTADADGFALPDFLKMLLGFVH
jgi:hypothetical protein